MPPLCTYYGPEFVPTELEAVILDGGLADLHRPGDPTPIVAGVRLVDTPEIGCAVPCGETEPAPSGGSAGDDNGGEPHPKKSKGK